MTHGSIAARVRKNKEAHPERYCPVPNCLWRSGGQLCPKHRSDMHPCNDCGAPIEIAQELCSKCEVSALMTLHTSDSQGDGEKFRALDKVRRVQPWATPHLDLQGIAGEVRYLAVQPHDNQPAMWLCAFRGIPFLIREDDLELVEPESRCLPRE